MLYINGQGVAQSLAKGRQYLQKGEGLGDKDGSTYLKSVEKRIAEVT